MSVLSKLGTEATRVPFRQTVPCIAGLAVIASVWKLYGQGGSRSRKRTVVTKSGKTSSGDKAHVNPQFIMRLRAILKILIPKWFCKETFYLILVALSLLCRTYADVWMITTSTRIEASIIERDTTGFVRSVLSYFFAMPPISVVNALLKFSLAELKLRFRTRLTTHLYDKYLKSFTFYKMSNLDNRIANADQLLTQDVDKFCEGLVDLYSNLSKPIVDVALYVARLGGALGFQAPAMLGLYLLASGIFLTNLRKPIGKLTIEEQGLEGEFRFVNSRLIMNSEEIAFYQGQQREKTTIMSSFDNLVNHLRKVILFRFNIGFVDNIVAKYFATVVGWFAVSRAFFDTSNEEMMAKSKNELIQDYYNSGRMMFRLAEALGRLALAGREMTRLAGFTSRVDGLIRVLDDLEEGTYQRTMVTDTKKGDSDPLDVPLEPGSGDLYIRDNLIRFEGVPLVTPNGDVLIRSLDFEVPSGRNVLVCGPNGCGKSSLFRVLGELWPLFGGTLTKPAKGKLFYVPQRPYMTLGTLRDQVIYPDRHYDMLKKGIKDEDLEEMLENVQLGSILTREGGWEAVQDWMDVLSGGEKQRIAVRLIPTANLLPQMARLFYHRPQFAILDECTSAVSVDVEGAMYRLCKEKNITLFTVSHRKSLWVHHEYYLYMDGRGSYTFAKIEDGTQQFGS